MVETKEINIAGQKYKIKSNALTWTYYQNKFPNNNWHEDLSKVMKYTFQMNNALEEVKKENPKLDENKAFEEATIKCIEYFGSLVQMLLQMTWAMIYTADQECKGYEEFLDEIPEIYYSDEWISEVINLLGITFR